MPKVNQFEVNGRLRKVERYVEAIHEIFPKEGIEVRGNEAAVAWGLRQWTDRQWADLAIRIGAYPPSELTRAAICDRIERDAEGPAFDADDPRFSETG